MIDPSPILTRNTWVVLIAIVVILAGMKAAQALVVPFMLSVFIATIASTPIRAMNRLGIPNWLSVTTVFVLLILCLLGLGLVMVNAIREFLAEQSAYEVRVREMASGVIQSLRNLGLDFDEQDLMEIVDPSRIVQVAGQSLQTMTQLLSNTFLIVLTVIFILAEGTALPRKLNNILSEKGMGSRWLQQFVTNLSQYMAVKTLTSLCTGVSVTILLLILGVDFAILWGLLAFFLNYIPNIGSVIAAAPAVLIATVQLGLGPACIALIGYVLINVGIGAGIEPRFLGKTMGLSTLVVFVSLIFWGWMFGPIGMLLSVPLTMTMKIALETSESTMWIAQLLGPAGVQPKG